MTQAMIAGSLLSLFDQPAFISPDTAQSSFVSFQYRLDKAVDQLGVVFRLAKPAWEEMLQEESTRYGVGLV
jgi:hypothetical protein